MKRFKLAVSNNPVFNTVTGLSNTTFDPSNVVNNRGASEGQVKYVYDLIKALQDWLDENGCSDDPYAIIRQKVDELEEAIGVCCANPQDTLIQMLNDRLTALQTAQEQCCQAMDDSAYQALVTRLTALETSVEGCCNNCQEQIDAIIQGISRESGENSDVIITETCDEEVTITYNFDISQETDVSGAGKLVGDVNAVAETGTNIIRYFFSFASSGLGRHSKFAWGDGTHQNIVFEMDESNGNISIRTRWHRYQGASVVQLESIPTIDPSTNPNVYLGAMTEKGCVVTEPLPYSAFDFSGIDG